MKYPEKKVIIFDLDGTLAPSKSPLQSEMADVLVRLLAVKKAAVISGGNMEQMKAQFFGNILAGAALENLFILPTSGSSMFEWQASAWKEVYREAFTEEERAKIKAAFLKVLEDDERPKEIFGERIEDRGSQVTFSGLGQEAPLELKEKWDPDQSKRKLMVVKLQDIIPEFSLGIGGTTSIDVTKKGIDKAYGIKELSSFLNTPIADMLFVGDKLFPGGNDWAAKSTGIDCEEVADPSETKKLIQTMLE